MLRLSSFSLTARELICERLEAECSERLDGKAGCDGARLVQPDAVEKTLNMSASPTVPEGGKRIDLALSAFQNNRFILLVDAREIETPEEEIEINESTIVTFLKLKPLAGDEIVLLF